MQRSLESPGSARRSHAPRSEPYREGPKITSQVPSSSARSSSGQPSKESWEQFRDSILRRRIQAGIEGGFTSPPEETVIDLYKIMP
jgi:hypothetical protein